MDYRLLRKWYRWLDRILNEQLTYLLINERIFRQFSDCISSWAGTDQASDLAEWMTNCYVAYAGTAVRKMVEEPPVPARNRECPNCHHVFPTRASKGRSESVSLIILLREIEKNSSMFTLGWFRRRYITAKLPTHFADRDFYDITRDKRATLLQSSRVKRDIERLIKMVRPVRQWVNKVIAHTERDRRKINRLKFEQLDIAINSLADTYRRYCLLIKGSCPNPLIPELDYDVVSDLRTIWPERR
jgi:hypothetical protein